MATPSDSVGNVTALKLITADSTAETYETTITNKKIMVSPTASYTQVDTFGRALANLSTNDYQDTILITSVSVNDVMAEGE